MKLFGFKKEKEKKDKNCKVSTKKEIKDMGKFEVIKDKKNMGGR